MKRALIVHPFGIGDTLFATPLVRALHEQGAEVIDLILGSRTRELFETNPMVDEIFVIDRDQIESQNFLKNICEIGSLVRKLRARRYDVLFDFSCSRQYSFFAAFFASIPKRIGFSYKNRGLFLTKKIELQGGFKGKHAAEYGLDLIDLAGLKRPLSGLELFFSDRDVKETEDLLRSLGLDGGKPYLVIAPGGGDSWGKDAHLKQWPVEYFARLAGIIECENAMGRWDAILAVGGPKDRALGEALASLIDARTVNLCGETSLRVSALLLKTARLLLANDGGLVHLASAVNVPTVAFYGPADPVVYGPWPPSPFRIPIVHETLECRPCYRDIRYNSACQHANCLRKLMPDVAYQTLCERGFFKILKRECHD